MLTISTIPEALAELSKHTGRAWTDSELFDVATTCGIELHAAPPITAQTTIQEFVIGEGLKEKFRSSPGHAVLAVLFPWQVQQLWIGGETATNHPNETGMEGEGEYHFFTEPVRVTREQVRIKARSLGKILDAWSKAQAGRWIVDTAQPGGMRCQNVPNWMFPTDAPAAKVKTGTVTTPPPDTNEEVHTGLDGAPYLQKGKNTRDKVDAWVKFQAKKMFKDGDIASDLVERIYLEANKWGYQSDRTNEGETISKATITKMLPAKITGGRGKNRGKSKK